jgi:hypothetical protein
VPGKIIEMPSRSRSSDEVLMLHETVMIFHESADCPGIIAERATQDPTRIEVYCAECQIIIGAFLAKEWRSIVEFLALLPSNDAA